MTDITDKDIELLNDATDGINISNCCSARIYYPDICADCKEHCEGVREEGA